MRRFGNIVQDEVVSTREVEDISTITYRRRGDGRRRLNSKGS